METGFLEPDARGSRVWLPVFTLCLVPCTQGSVSPLTVDDTATVQTVTSLPDTHRLFQALKDEASAVSDKGELKAFPLRKERL